MVRLWSAFIDHYRVPRVLGLDLMRIWASLTVVAFHGSNIQHRGLLMRHGGLAVDVFFVLSGWLLTRQALRIHSHGLSPWAFATGFWTRRWFRILPAYWLILVLVTALGVMLPLGFGLTPTSLIRHLLFLQTVFQPNLYGVTWSLVAEEGFYLLLPFVILGSALVGRRRVTIACFVIALLVPMIGRAIGLRTIDPFTLQQIPQVRFDGLVVGASLAAMWALPSWKARILRSREWLFAGGAAGFVFLYMFAPDGTLFYTVGLLAFCVSVGMILPQMTVLRWPAFVPAIFPILVTFLSDLTYPLYLFHPLGYKLTDIMAIHGRAGYFAVSLPLILAGAVLIHLAVERPFLALRARITTGGRLADAAEPQPTPQVAAAV